MVQMSEKLIAASRRSNARLAGRDTPFIFDCWYVAGFGDDFDRSLKQRTILGRPLVLFRSLDGKAVALSDRCVHRSFPLSKSRLDGDTIICGYHGMRYDVEGICTEAPAVAGECPRGIGVRSYSLREQGSLVWIWMGDGEPAPDLPLDDWVSSPLWPASQQYYHLSASYIALHENLLDLTHLSFLHANSFGTPDYASAPYEVDLDEAAGRFALMRSVMPTRLPPVWAEPTGLVGVDAARITRSTFVGPSAHTVNGIFYALHEPEDARPDTQIITAHLPTPETATTTHYFIHHGRNFAIDDPAVTDFMQDQLAIAFTEDVVGLAAVEGLVRSTQVDDMYEISLASDRAGLAMRRWLYKMAENAKKGRC